MRVQDIAAHERSFFQTGVDNAGHKFIFSQKTIPFGNSGKQIKIVDCIRDNGDETYHKNFAHEKEQVVLHFTAGYLKGDIQALTTPNRNVSVAFVIPRSGEILRLWPSELWSYHLGNGASGGNEVNSKRSVGIELSNVGPLVKSGNTLKATWGSAYCDLNETDFYQELSSPFRDHTYYASFTEAQYTSLIILLDYLEEKHMIPLNFLSEADRYNKLSGTQINQFKGVVSHANYRGLNNDGKWEKWDIGPAFDWDRVMDSV
ncbi:MAG: N-acetylmuramoyl-L-alanine amidase [Gilvibacter sp.]